MEKAKVLKCQNQVLKALAGKVDDFYLAGGTALSLFYFQHRLSFDVDFFTHDFSGKRIAEIISYLGGSLKKEIKLIGQNLKPDKAKWQIFNIYFTDKDTLKIDFVEDVFKLLKQPKAVEGIKIFSLDDIYIRKLYAIVGVIVAHDIIGKKAFIGGRREAKDFYDLYFLSHTFMPLAKFAHKYADAALKEGLVTWFRTYDRMQMMDGVLSLAKAGKTNYKAIELHFKKEIDEIIRQELGGI